MGEGFISGRQAVDPATWERRTIFEFFRKFDEPFHGVCVRVDCTGTYRYAKEHGLSVFLCLLHRSLMVAQEIENFRTRIVDGVVWRFDRIHGGSAVGRANGTIGFGHYDYHEDLREFVAGAQVEVERVRLRDDLERPSEVNLIRYSVLPWMDFTSISHAREFGGEDSAPRITFGKISETGGRWSMPVSIHVHHGLADGLHVGRYLERFEELLGETQALHCQGNLQA